MDPGPAYEIQARRQDVSYVDVQVIFFIWINLFIFSKIVSRAGHHVYADAPEEFCRLLGQISDRVDENADLPGAADSDEWRDRVFN